MAQYRHEWKHMIDLSDRIAIRQRLRAVARPDGHARDGRYLIRSLYFDSPGDTALREKLDGVNRREKFRLRCYNGDTSLIRLEKKSKRNGLGSKELTEALERRGIRFEDVAVYRTKYDHPLSPALRAAVNGGAVRYAAFTSASTVKGFVGSVGEDTDFSRLVGLCIGEQTAAEARRHGIEARVAKEATIDALAELARECGEADQG